MSLTQNYRAVTRKSLCKELEKELELQIGMKTEMEIAMKLLEKDTHEKQDTLVALRQQLEEVKAINLQMFHKSQVCPSWRTERAAVVVILGMFGKKGGFLECMVCYMIIHHSSFFLKRRSLACS